MFFPGGETEVGRQAEKSSTIHEADVNFTFVKWGLIDILAWRNPEMLKEGLMGSFA